MNRSCIREPFRRAPHHAGQTSPVGILRGHRPPGRARSLLLLALASQALFVATTRAQTANGFLDFGSTAGGTTATTANTGFGGVRVGSGGGGFTLQNPGQAIGSGAELRGIAPTTTSINSVGLTSNEFGTAAATFTVSFELHLSGGSSGVWYFFAGNGASFGTAQSSGFTGAQVFSGLRWTFGASGGITTANRNAASWSATGISGTPFAQDTACRVTIVGNNSASTVNYGASQSVAAGKLDLWVDGALVGDDLAKAELASGTPINAFRFYGESSSGNVAALALDNIRWYNSCVLPPTHLAFAGVPGSGASGANLSSFTVEARSGSATGPVATAFGGAITLTKASGAGSLSGTLSPSASSGIATFPDIQFSAADTYTLAASAASPIAGATSGNIVISAGSSAPSVSTVAASATNTTTATVNGNVTADGGAPVLDRGVCYKTSSGVTMADNKTASGSGTGSFAVNLSSLAVNQQYFFKAYATNSAGATLGSELGFTTLANAPGAPAVANPSSSTLDVIVDANGNPAGTTFAIQADPDNNGSYDGYVQGDGSVGVSAVWQTAATWGTKTVTGLPSSQTVAFRVKARNGENVETAFGPAASGATSAGAPTPTPPTVASPTAANITSVSADLGGTIVSTNNGTVTERGVYWSTSSGFTPPGAGTKAAASGSFGNGAFTIPAGGLPSGTLLYYRAFATNSAGFGMSSESSFTTVPAAPAISAATALTYTSFAANWSAATGATNYLLDAATDAGFTAYVAGYQDRSVGNVTSFGVTGLSPNVSYRYRVRARNSAGTSADSSAFATNTPAAPASVTTTPISAITTTTAGSGGNVLMDGGTNVTARGVCWNTTGTPTTSDATSSDGTGTGGFTSSLTSLTPGQTYYVRAYAVNSVGTSYGGQETFTASCYATAPSGLHADPTNASSFTAVWDAFSGATGYRLDVSTSAQFASPASAVTEATTNVGGGSSSSYLTRQWTNQVAWTSTLTRIDQTIDGAPAITLQNASGAFLLSQTIPGGLSELAFVHQLKFTGAGTVDVFVNSTKVLTNVAYGASVTTTRVSGLSFNGNFVLGISNSSAGRVAISSVSWVGQPSPAYVAGYSNRAVAGTSQSVTGLTQGATYYSRVRAESAFCTTGNSSTSQVTTVVVTPNAHFASATSTAGEAAGLVTVPVQLSFAADATVQVAVAGSSTAIEGVDFTLASTQLVFTAGGPTQQDVSVSLADDATIEPSETVALNLVAGPGAVLAGTTNHVLTVTDNEPSVQFAVSSTNASEGSGALNIVVYKSSAANDVSGQIALGGQAADPADYTISSTSFTLNGATTSATITVTLVNDAVAEFTEFLFLNLTNLSAASAGSPSGVAVLIEDNDTGALQPGDVAVVGFHMTDPDDFAFVAMTNIPGGTIVKFTDKGWNGLSLTGNEGTVEWQSPGGGITGGTVVVISNLTDTGSIQSFGNFALATGGDQLLVYQGPESSPAFLFGLNNRLNGIWQGAYTNSNDSVLPSALTNGTTAVALTNAANSRYNGTGTGERPVLLASICTPGNWSGGATRASVALPAGPFTITAAAPWITVLGANGGAIPDGDVTPTAADGTDFGGALVSGGTVDRSFTITNSGSLSLTVSNATLSGAHASDFSVTASPAGTVASGAATTFTVRFDPSASGVRTATVEVASSDATRNPYDFTVVGTGVAALVGSVSFASAASSPTETVGSVSVDLQISAQSDATVGVRVAASSTATLGADYGLSATQLVFSASGATQQSLVVSIVNDAIVEGGETVVLQLVNLSGATAGPVTNHVLTIGDDDNVLLTPGDIALIGRINNSSPDAFALVVLTNIAQGQVVYFTDNGWQTAGGYRGASASAGAGNETLVKLVFSNAVAAGTILSSTNSTASYGWIRSGVVPGATAGSFSDLTLNQGGEQICAFQGPATNNPLLNPSANLFILDDTLGFEDATSSASSDIPSGLGSNANTALSFNFASSTFIGLDLQKAGSNTLTSKAGWLAFIANPANWLSGASGTLPSGQLNSGITCDAGIAPVMVVPASTTVPGGGTANFTFAANDPSCVAPSLSVTGLPSGATFTTTITGTNRVGTLTWTTTTGDHGVHPVRFTATDGTLSTSRTVRIYVSQPAEGSNGSGVPLSLTNWAVPVTNLFQGSSGNATLVWNAVSGLPYDLHASSNTPGAGTMAWQKIASVTAGAAQVSALVNGGATQKFFAVTLAGEAPGSDGIWAVIQPAIGAGISFLAPPVVGGLGLDGAFGETLAGSLAGDNGGVGDGTGDELYLVQPDGSWVSFYLDEAGMWRDGIGSSPSTNRLAPGQGALLIRYGAPTTAYFAGPVGNTGAKTNSIAPGWNIVGLSEGRAVNLATAFDHTASGAPQGSFDETTADLFIILNKANGKWRRFQRLPDGTWLDLSTFATASFRLMPGEAGYYFRTSGGGNLNVKF